MFAASDPNIAFLLVLLGILGTYCEFVRPGLVIPGVGGGLLAMLGVSALASFPLSWIGGGLLLLAAALLAFDPVVRGLGVGGAIAMTAGAALLVAGPVGISWVTAAAGSVPFAGVTVFLGSVAMRARRNKAGRGWR